MVKKRMRGICLLLFSCALLAACGKEEGQDRQDTYRQYGINCLESGRYAEAVTAFQNALDTSVGRVGEKEIDTCFYKARAQFLNGAVEDALDTYEAVIAFNGDGRAYYLRGSLYFDIGEQDKALADYRTAVEAEKSNYQIYIGIYEKLSSHNMEEEGLKYLSNALEIKSEKPEDLLYKGRICFFLGEYDDAVTYLKKAVEGKQPLAPYYLGQAYEAKGDDANAQKYIKQYLDSGAATSYDLYELGMTEMADGDYGDAIVYYNAGLEMDSVPNKQNLLRSLIAAHERNGDFAAAKKAAAEYVKLYPTDEEMSREYTFLQTR